MLVFVGGLFVWVFDQDVFVVDYYLVGQMLLGWWNVVYVYLFDLGFGDVVEVGQCGDFVDIEWVVYWLVFVVDGGNFDQIGVVIVFLVIEVDWDVVFFGQIENGLGVVVGDGVDCFVFV